ncbi:MAG TPA: hypothetical protein PLX39_15505 [Pyrinomonadaceae bacterium]|nr:hypothetical protein [Pyrinomonadaceae bacterium]
MITLKITKNFQTAAAGRQLPFAIATTFTRTVKDAQAGILGTLDNKFTLRSQWYRPTNKFGVKIKAARKNDLTAEVGTNADWLEPHETGGTRKSRQGRHVALPVIGEIGRRSFKSKIPRASTPSRLLASGNALIMKTRSGKTGIYVFKKGLKREVKDSIILNAASRESKGPGRPRTRFTDDVPFRLVYGLEGYRSFKKNSAIVTPAMQVIKRRLDPNFARAMDEALRTAK